MVAPVYSTVGQLPPSYTVVFALPDPLELLLLILQGQGSQHHHL